eukprot:m.32891 g.32891  ORF g.32891 m.32891 type:complete len:454 (-) comp9432_c0_seq1:207-1568(-)
MTTMLHAGTQSCQPPTPLSLTTSHAHELPCEQASTHNLAAIHWASSSAHSHSNSTPSFGRSSSVCSSNSGSAVPNSQTLNTSFSPASPMHDGPGAHCVPEVTAGFEDKSVALDCPAKRKKPLNAFMLWCSQGNRAKMMSDFPNMHQSDISKALGQRWKELDAATHARFKEMASERQAAESAKHEASVVAWQATKMARTDNTELDGCLSAMSADSGIGGGPSVVAAVRSRSRRARPTQRVVEARESHSARGRAHWCEIRPSQRVRAASDPLPLTSSSSSPSTSTFPSSSNVAKASVPVALARAHSGVFTPLSLSLGGIATTVYPFQEFDMDDAAFTFDFGLSSSAPGRLQSGAFSSLGALTATPTLDTQLPAAPSDTDMLSSEAIDALLNFDSQSSIGELPEEWGLPVRPFEDAEIDFLCNANVEEFYGLRSSEGALRTKQHQQKTLFFNPFNL